MIDKDKCRMKETQKERELFENMVNSHAMSINFMISSQQKQQNNIKHNY